MTKKKVTVKDRVKDNQIVSFEYYRDKKLWYRCADGFKFPVPIEDIGTATFKSHDRAMLFMRYIKNYMEEIEGESDS